MADYFELYSTAMFSFFLAFVRDHQNAEDLVQDLFLTFHLKPDGLLHATDHESYLFRSAHNRALDFLRSQKKYARETPGRDYPLLTNPAGENDEYVEEMNDALSKLSEQLRAIVLMKFFHGLTFNQMAEIQQQPSKTIQSQYYTAINKLKEILGS